MYDERALCYIRTLDGIIESKLSTEKLQGYIDLVDNESKQLDHVAQQQRMDLIENTIPMKFRDRNIKQYKIDWSDDILTCDNELTKNTSGAIEQYRQYLREFQDDFVADVQRQIRFHTDRDWETTYGGKVMHGPYTEVLHHTMFARQKCQVFCGREELLTQVQNYISGNQCSTLPLIVHGKSGYGKTAFMAKIALSVPTWLKDSSGVVTTIRFMGTSPDSTTIQCVLKSLIIQLCYVYRLDLPREENLEKIGDLCREFNHLLNLVSKSSFQRVLVIILDAVDQLLSRYSAHRMSWLPKELPSNVYMVISMLTDR